jgi:tetratricopeptide (TPR) repeat protein
VVAVKPRAFRIQSRGVEGVETHLVGRDAELKSLQKAFLIAIEDGETQVVTVSGEPGIGKSRLLYEFEQWADLRPEGFVIFRGRANPALRERPYALIRDLIAFRFEILDTDSAAVTVRKVESGVAGLLGQNDETAHLIAYLCGFDVNTSAHLQGILNDPREMARRARWALIRFFTALAVENTVMIELEDLRHADDASLDLLHDLFEANDDLHLLVVCCVRTEFFERRPSWGAGQPFHRHLELQPLDKRDSRELVRELLQKVADVPKELRDLLVERAEGNPFFMEELIKMLIDNRVVIKESDDVWRVEASRLDSFQVPSTLAGLIEARLDTLLAPEKLTLQRASVVGRIFYDSVLQAIDYGDDTHVTDLPGVLAKLVERQFIDRRATSGFAGSAEYIFTSAMLRDALYDHLLERQLTVYHSEAARWLAGLERSDEYLTQIAAHYERAGETLLGIESWMRAGEIAAGRGVYRVALELYQSALTLFERLPEESREANAAMRLNLLMRMGEAQVFFGDLPASEPTLAQALALAQMVGNQSAEAWTHYQLSLLKTTKGDYPSALAHLDRALPLARKCGDRQIMAQVQYGLANTHFRAGNWGQGIEAAQACIASCEAIGNETLRIYALNRVATLNFYKDRHYETALPYLEESLAIAQRIGHQDGEFLSQFNLATFASYVKDLFAAVAHGEAALGLAREDGNPYRLTMITGSLASFYVMAGKREQAPALLRESLEMARRMEAPASTMYGLQAAAVLKLTGGDVAGGLRLLGLSTYHPSTGSDDQANVERWTTYSQDRLGFSEDEIDAMLLTGKDLDLNSVVDELLKELEAQ